MRAELPDDAREHRPSVLAARCSAAERERLERLAGEHLELTAAIFLAELRGELLHGLALLWREAVDADLPDSPAQLGVADMAREPPRDDRHELVVRARGRRPSGARPGRPSVRSGARARRGQAARRADRDRRRRGPVRRRASSLSTSPAARNAAASVGPPSRSSDWTPSAASACELLVERRRAQLELGALGERAAPEGETARLARDRRRRGRRAAARRRERCPSRPRPRPTRRAARAPAAATPRR